MFFRFFMFCVVHSPLEFEGPDALFEFGDAGLEFGEIASGHG